MSEEVQQLDLELKLKCPTCSESNDVGSNFCKICGARLASEQKHFDWTAESMPEAVRANQNYGIQMADIRFVERGMPGSQSNLNDNNIELGAVA